MVVYRMPPRSQFARTRSQNIHRRARFHGDDPNRRRNLTGTPSRADLSPHGRAQVALMPDAPLPGPGGWLGYLAPVIGETGAAGRGRLGDDREGPVMIRDHCLGYKAAPRPGQPAGIYEDPESIQPPALARVGYVPIGFQLLPVAARSRPNPVH